MSVMRLAGAVGLVALLCAAGCGPPDSAWAPVEPPVAAPDFELAQLDGGQVRLSGLQGRVVVMEFWATWCGPCRYSTPSLEAMYRKYRDQGVTVLLINQAESPTRIQKWAEGRFTAPILLDVEQVVARQYRVTGLPTLFVIDRQGMIRYHEAGYSGGLEHNLQLIFQELLAA